MTLERTHWNGCWHERTHHECALARIAALEAMLAAERIRPSGKSFAYINTMLRAGRDVMAVIHRDGGHYREAHGDRKAADDAISIINNLRADLRVERKRRKAAEAVLRDLAEYVWRECPRLLDGDDREGNSMLGLAIEDYFTRYKD